MHIEEKIVLTPFGRFLRKLRIDQGELLKDMAEKIGVTPSYLSAVEMGKKAVPDTWIYTLRNLYQSIDEQDLQRLAELSKPEFRVEVPRGSEDLRREAVAVFARKVGTLDHDSLTKLLEVMIKKGECE